MDTAITPDLNCNHIRRKSISGSSSFSKNSGSSSFSKKSHYLLLGEQPDQESTDKNEDRHTMQNEVTKEWDGMAGEWDDLAAGYSDGLHAILWSKLGIEDPSSLTVVDFGCGTGLLTQRIASQVERVYALDAAPQMVELLQDKIRTRPGLDNVTAKAGILGYIQTDSANPPQDQKEFASWIDSLAGTVDVIVASSVLNFVPDEDLDATCRELGRLLKPQTGILFHTDWPSGDGEPADGMTAEKAQRMYTAAGLTAETTDAGMLSMGKDEAKVFFGLARKS